MRPLTRSGVVLLGSVLGSITGCQPSGTPAAVARTALDQQVYIWQRQWTAQHPSALQRSHSTFSHLRVLAAQAHSQAGWQRSTVDFTALQHDQRPIIMVIRLDGQLTELNRAERGQQILRLIQDWQQQPIKLVGVEIDHDCASAKLGAYVDFLQQLRPKLPSTLGLSITVLPAWLDHPQQLSQLRQLTDHSVLQVHAVNPLTEGLFEPKQAATWIKRYEQQAARPFYVALPAYGAGMTASGAVESEVLLPEGGTRQEYTVDPRAVAQLIRQLAPKPPTQLKGWVWFRLPLSHDRRAWSWHTLQAVIQHQSLRAQLQVQVQPSAAGLYDLRLVSFGDLAAELPSQITLSGQQCTLADPTPTYHVQTNPNGLSLSLNPRLQNKSLAAGKMQNLGWVRCDQLNSSRIFNHASPSSD